ncbi:MAG: esterase-like activity of phytase family protein [Myxococcales bacterium]|nr:esterase-like activity of phytase family protein [Myxococcales bacterium]MBK7198459.1 esterase-like activity of phytase family protein [Myxococcales bacterium]MBP6842138.1 esterase-like activity of phytase family protein [Kofleriaceae bacterium]
MRRALAAVAGLAALVACGSRGPGIDRERAAATFTRVAIDTRGDHGLSGLAVDAGGTMWTVAERGAVALAITLDGDRATAVRYPVRGVPADEDLEAVAIAADGLWVGTEGRERGVARVFHLVRQGDALVATGAPIELRQAEVGVEIGANHGAEGVCGAGDVVAIALETAGGSGAQRWAPIVSVDVAGGARRVQRVALTTTTGKLSALDCWRDGARTWAVAVERHFAVTRLLRFELGGADATITPEVLLDLGPILRGSLNLEGLVRLPDGRLVAVVDNQYRTITGPDELLVFAAPLAP